MGRSKKQHQRSKRDSHNSTSGNRSFMSKLRNTDEETSWLCQCDDCLVSMPGQKRLHNKHPATSTKKHHSSSGSSSWSDLSLSSYCDEEACCLHTRPCVIARASNVYNLKSIPSTHTIYENISVNANSLPPPPVSYSSKGSQNSTFDSDAFLRSDRCLKKDRKPSQPTTQRDSCCLHGSECEGSDAMHDASLVFLKGTTPQVEDDTKTQFENNKNAHPVKMAKKSKKKENKTSSLTLIEPVEAEDKDSCCKHGRKCEIAETHQVEEIKPLSVREIFDLPDPNAIRQPVNEDYENIGTVPGQEAASSSKSNIVHESSKTNCRDYENVEFAEKHMFVQGEFPPSRAQSLRSHSAKESQSPIGGAVEKLLGKNGGQKEKSSGKTDQLKKAQKENEAQVKKLKKQLEEAQKNEAKAREEVEKYKKLLKESWQLLKSVVSNGANLI